MIPLKVALFVKNRPRNFRRGNRAVGPWSYPVPEFTWTHFVAGRDERIDRREYEDYDLIVNEDGCWASWFGDGPPVVGWFWDSTWTKGHFDIRCRQAGRCDLALIDHDDLSRFRDCGPQIARMLYCVNDSVFRDYGQEKTVDVCDWANVSHCTNRPALRVYLAAFCDERSYTFEAGAIPDIYEYAQAFNRAKVSICLPRVPQNRPHRVFDVMASRSCLLCGPTTDENIDGRGAWLHYVPFKGAEDCTAAIDELMQGDMWKRVAYEGHRFVTECHTWAIRAGELRDLIQRRLGI